ncbi:MAG: hypothetical protein Q9218_001961, partial [Villophora microphyllina]
SDLSREDITLRDLESTSHHVVKRFGEIKSRSSDWDAVPAVGWHCQKRNVVPSAHFLFRPVGPPIQNSTRRTARILPNLSSSNSSKAYALSPQILRSSTAYTLTALILVFVSSTLLVASSRYLEGANVESEDHKMTADRIQVDRSTYGGTMTGSVLPGRPGNLTADQDAKLRELWTATLRVFGVQTKGQSPDVEEEQSGSGTATPDKQAKKKKHGMFRRNKEDADDGASTDQNDKYGQSKEFQQVLAAENPENLRKAFWSMVKHDHPDALLLRFLRARKWNVHNALVMLIATMNWRMKEVHVDDDVMKNGEGRALIDSTSNNAAVKKEAQDFLAQLRLGKSFLHGTDKEGRPMCFVRVRLHKQGEQSEASLERYTVYTIETARLLLARHVDTAAIVFDMTGFSMANMDYSPVKFMIKCFEANYPESLGVVLVHKSPWIFQSIWKIIKGWLDPVVAAKVHFTKDLAELEQFVEKSHIIKELGGDDPWEYHYIEPIPDENKQITDENARQRLVDERASTVKEYETTTQEWIADSENRTGLQQKRNDLAEQLRSGYWRLDPFTRARSLYDRIGLIREGGVIQYYGKPETPNAPKPLVASPHNGPLPAEHKADDLD